MPGAFMPPPTPQREHVDVMHGVRIEDPYRWLEDSCDPAVAQWTREQNDASARFLRSLPGRERIEARLDVLLSVAEVQDARIAGAKLFTLWRDRDHEQPTLLVRDEFDATDRVLLDVSGEAPDAVFGLDWWYPSRDGSLIAYGLSEGGDEWSDLHVRDVATGEDLAERIPRVRSASIAWFPDNGGFYYTRYPRPGEVAAGKENYYRRVYRHELGTPWADDPLVWGEGRGETEMPNVLMDPDGRWLVIDVDYGWLYTEIYVLDLHRSGDGFREITPPGDSTHEIVCLHDGVLYSRTHADAPNGRLIGCRLADAAWHVVIPEREGTVLETVVPTSKGFVSAEIEQAAPVVRRYTIDGTSLGDVPLPGLGMVPFIHGSVTSEGAAVGYYSFLSPTTVLAVDGSGPVRVLIEPELPEGLDPADYTISREWFTSKDGTDVPMFLVHRRGLARDGRNPTLVHVYGGYGLVTGSRYVPDLPLWLEMGGVYASPCLRGGGELGMAWHRDGMLERKQHTIDDAIAAAEHLVASGVTSTWRLGIRGVSAGGLVVGAAVTQRPDLFRAARAAMPLTDMLRYHLFKIARIWIPEFGSAENPVQFPYLHAYSPYHHVEDGVAYPAMLFTCALNDSRVDPLHARKMAARMQVATVGDPDRPVLFRADEDAGHGAGKPISQQQTEFADMWAFFGWALGVDWTEEGNSSPLVPCSRR